MGAAMTGAATIEPCVPVCLYWTPGHPGIAQSRAKWLRPPQKRRLGLLPARCVAPVRLPLRGPPTRYPFIGAPSLDNALLRAVYALVPASLPGRDDVCQDLIVALLDGRESLDRLRAAPSRLRSFITAFYAANFEARGFARSLDAPLTADGGTLHDLLAAPEVQP
jgi:hypothetical protein